MSDRICHFCKRKTETVSHLFYYCGVVKESLTNIELILNSIVAHTYQETVTLSFHDIILGICIKKPTHTNLGQFYSSFIQMGIVETKKCCKV